MMLSERAYVKILSGITLAYIACALLYLGITIPQTFRADFLYHLSLITAWDHARDYGQYLPFMFEFQSGHIIAVQKLYALANFYLFHESALFAKTLGIATMLAYWVLPVVMWRRYRGTAGLSAKRALAMLLLALLVFSPHGFEIYTWADSVFCHYPVAIFGLLSLASLRNFLATKSAGHAAAACASAFLAVVTDGTGWAILPAGLALTFMYLWRYSAVSKRAIAIALGGGSLAILAAALWVLSNANAGQEVSGFTFTDSLLQHPDWLVTHYLATIAGPWAHFNIRLAWPAGIIVLLALAWIGRRAWRHGSPQSLIWLCLSLFGLCGCAMVSLTRFNIDHDVGFVAYRYTIYALPIYTGLLGMWVTTLGKSPADWRISRRIVAICAVLVIGMIFVASSLRAHKAETGQNAEVMAFTQAAPYWNMKAAFRMASSYELPRLYLETLPLLKAAGRASLLTRDFAPAGTIAPDAQPALDAIRQGQRGKRPGHACNTEVEDFHLYRVDQDERFEPTIRLLGTEFIRMTGYLRDPAACDAADLPVFAMDSHDNPLCMARTGRLMHDDLPAADRRDDIMRTRFAFDFSCPLKDAQDSFPIRVFGYNPTTASLFLVGGASTATVHTEAEQQ